MHDLVFKKYIDNVAKQLQVAVNMSVLKHVCGVCYVLIHRTLDICTAYSIV